ncbi:MAG TPA: FtsQ-type POTRA domain-containing protein [Candidatus Dormibacteraeota bacterium]|nr:FtsQ-type POTRA domain-containing protein [Candidatus Dormibacteraeota bacterium]
MRFRRRSSVLRRAPWPQGLERTEPLRGQMWTRSERALKEPDVHWIWRTLSALVAVAEIVILAWLWFGPALAVHEVHVLGSRHMSPAQVGNAAGLSGDVSIISVDETTSQQRLLNEVWIRSATVQAQLPGTVVVQVREWEPVAAYHAGPSARLFWLSSLAVVLGTANTAAGVVDIQGPAGGDPHVGDRALDPALLTAMVNIQRGFPTLVGQDVAGFIFDSCGNLTLIAKRGWRVYFGRVLTPEEFATLNTKLIALKAIAGTVNYNSSDLEYVNVMNPVEPAVGFKSLEPPAPSPSPVASTPPSPNPCK